MASSPRWLAFGLLSFMILSAGWLSAQPPRKEEEEDPKEKARPVVPVPVVPDMKEPPKAAPGVDGDVTSFKDEAAKAEHPVARDLFRGLQSSYDRLQPNFAGGTVYRIVPLTLFELPEGEFEVEVLEATLKNVTTRKFSTGTGWKLMTYELIVLEEVDKYLAKKNTLSRDEQLDYAARAIACGLHWHVKAVNDGKRVGKPWDAIAKQLRDRHLALLRERFNYYLAQIPPQYDLADAVGLKMLTIYKDNNEVMRDVYRLDLLRKRNELKSPTDAQLIKLRESLLNYERIPGKKDETLIADSRRRLKDRAAALVSESQDLEKKKMAAAALAKLRQAELIDPEHPAIVGARSLLKGKILYVGVPKLPERMSPATAESDAERWAVELMFEGLLQVIPDTEVVRYRPALAETLPAVMPLGRSFTLPKNARWSREGLSPMDARDVRGTLEMLRQPKFKDRWASDGLDVFETIDRIDDPFRLRLAYQHGVLEPLSRATFKILPFQQLQSLAKGPDDDEFARAPYGTGPFYFAGRERETAERECAVFRANPNYSQRSGKFGLPWIREIRMFVPDKSTLVNDVNSGQLHLYLDASTEMASRFRGEEGLKQIFRVDNTQIDRRIHLLAINHRKTDLQNDKLRLGLSSAIDRETILKDQFRGGNDKSHRSLTGPFPVKSWGTPATARTTSLFKPGAGGLMAEGLGNRTTKLQLAFCSENPKDGAICGAVKSQIENAGKNKDGKALVTIELVPLDAKTFREKVHLEHDFDLALTTFDYRDDLYSLSSLLDPEAAERGGRNFMGYLAGGTNPAEGDRRLRKLMDEAKQYRDFNKQVKDKTWDLHNLFNQRVPFIPLWQLDRSMVTHRDLQLHFDNPDAPVPPDRIDPATVFTGVEMWRLK